VTKRHAVQTAGKEDGQIGKLEDVHIRKQIGRKAYRETRDMQWEGRMGRQEN
jgi:hypothetical protein